MKREKLYADDVVGLSIGDPSMTTVVNRVFILPIKIPESAEANNPIIKSNISNKLTIKYKDFIDPILFLIFGAMITELIAKNTPNIQY